MIDNGDDGLLYGMTVELLTSDGTWARGKSLFVDRMFDKDGSETFDPTLCVEVETEIGLRRLRPGDKLIIEIEPFFEGH